MPFSNPEFDDFRPEYGKDGRTRKQLHIVANRLHATICSREVVSLLPFQVASTKFFLYSKALAGRDVRKMLANGGWARTALDRSCKLLARRRFWKIGSLRPIVLVAAKIFPVTE